MMDIVVLWLVRLLYIVAIMALLFAISLNFSKKLSRFEHFAIYMVSRSLFCAIGITVIVMVLMIFGSGLPEFIFIDGVF